MTTVGIAFLLAFLLATLATQVMIRVAGRLGVVDRPDGFRKIHTHATPRLGGIAIYSAFLGPLVALLLFPRLSTVSQVLWTSKQRLAGLLISATMALVLGLLDDVLDLRPRWKFFWQILIASAAFWFGFSIDALSNPFGHPLYLGGWAFPITVFWFVGCMNAVNLLDGLDGLAAGTCLFVSMTLFLVSVQFNNVLAMLLMGCVSGALLGFLFFNFPPAKIFLGDSGSMLLGFLIAALSLMGASRKAEAAVALFIPIVALGLPILDTSMAILRRWYKRLPISSPDRQHIHHVLVSMGYSKQRAVLILYAICLVLGGAALLITFARNEVVVFVIGSLIVTAFVCIRLFSGVRLNDVLDKLSRENSRRQRSAQARVLLVRLLHRLPAAPDVETVWGACAEAFDAFDLDSAELVLYGREGRLVEARTWRRADAAAAEPHPDGWSARLTLRAGDDPIGELVVGQVTNGKLPVLEEIQDLLRQVRDALAEHVVRLAPALADSLPPPAHRS